MKEEVKKFIADNHRPSFPVQELIFKYAVSDYDTYISLFKTIFSVSFVAFVSTFTLSEELVSNAENLRFILGSLSIFSFVFLNLYAHNRRLTTSDIRSILLDYLKSIDKHLLDARHEKPK